jgi:RsiW-degrading membrane proteinase PrsW (M82 family)
MILKVFLYGMLATFPAYLIEKGIAIKISLLSIPPFVSSLLYFFVVVGFTEEICKYFAAKWGAFSSSELDEPIDIIEYMIIAALGFAAFENLLYLLPQGGTNEIANALIVAIQRFIGATFLHALASATFGWFLVLAFTKQRREILLTLAGFFLAALLHGLFNFSIIEAQGYWKLAIPVAILIGLAIVVSWGMQKAKKMQSVCE